MTSEACDVMSVACHVMSVVGVDRLSAWPIIGADIKHFTIIDIGHFQNRFADNYYIYIFLCKQTYYLQVTLFIGE